MGLTLDELNQATNDTSGSTTTGLVSPDTTLQSPPVQPSLAAATEETVQTSEAPAEDIAPSSQSVDSLSKSPVKANANSSTVSITPLEQKIQEIVAAELAKLEAASASTSSLGSYNKFWVSVLGAVAQVVSTAVGHNDPMVAYVISVLTALGVVTVPNKD